MNVNNNELLNVFTNFINRKNSSEKKLEINFTKFQSNNEYFQNSCKKLTKFYKIMTNLITKTKII